MITLRKMYSYNITKAEIKKLEWIEKLKVASIIQKKKDSQEIIKIKETRKRLLESRNSKPFDNRVYMNHLPWNFNDKWVKKADITDEMIQREQELWEGFYT